MRRVLFWTPVVAGVIFLLLLGYYRRETAFSGQNDFATFYAGAKLAGTPDLYSRAANVTVIKRETGRDLGMMFIRAPFYAAILKPLAALPFLWAYAVFTAVSLACYVWFAARFTPECPALAFLASISIPFLADVAAGQDACFMLAILGGAILLTRRNRDVSAGLVLALCAYKPHLFLFLALLMVLKKRWKIVAAGAAGTAALTLLGMAVTGPAAIAQWVKVLRDPWINPEADGMPNIHGLVAVLNGGVRLEAALVATVVVAFLWMVLRTDNFELLFAASLVCGLLASFHSTLVDDLALFPVMILLLHAVDLVPLRALAGLILTPIPYFLALAGPPASAVLPLTLLAMLAGMVYSNCKKTSVIGPGLPPTLSPPMRGEAVVLR